MGDYVVLVERQTIIAYVEAASTAALIFDFCITFDSEVRWTWGRKWGIVRIAFVISRYMPIAAFVMYLYYTVESTRGEIPHPGRYIAINGAMNTVCAAAADTLLVARTHAFCGWGKRILIAISLIGVATIATALTITDIVTSKPGNSTGYSFEGGQNASMVSIVYGSLMIFQLVLMSLTLHKRFNFYRQESTPLVATVYRDGVIYMLCIALASMANCIGIATLPVNPIMMYSTFKAESEKPTGSRAERSCFTHPVQSTGNERIARGRSKHADSFGVNICSTNRNPIPSGLSRAPGYDRLVTHSTRVVECLESPPRTCLPLKIQGPRADAKKRPLYI